MKLITKITGAALAVAMMSTAVQAQQLGVKGGLAYTGGTQTGVSYAPGFLVGVGMDMNMMPVGIMIDVLYGMRKIGFDTGVSTIDLAYKAIEIPVQVKINVGPAFVSGGGFADFLIGDVTLDGTKVTGNSSSMYGAVVGVGAKMMHFQVEARYKLGLKDMYDDGDSKVRSFDVLLGYYF